MSLPFNSSGLLGGTAQPSFPDGDPGEVSVVQIGPLDVQRGTLVFAFRNNTSETISHVDWTATARSGGSIVGTGSSQGATPSWVAPGEAGLAYIYFETAAQIPDGTEYEFAVGSSPADTTSYNTAPLKVTEANLVGTSIVGGATNNTGADATGPFSVSIYCFDGDNLTGSPAASLSRTMRPWMQRSRLASTSTTRSARRTRWASAATSPDVRAQLS